MLIDWHKITQLVLVAPMLQPKSLDSSFKTVSTVPHRLSLFSEAGCSLPGKHLLLKLSELYELRVLGGNIQLKCKHLNTLHYSLIRDRHY